MKEEDLKQLFIEEFEELIKNFRIILPKLKDKLEDKKIIKNIYLMFHTIKGNSGVMGLQNLYQYCYTIESILKINHAINDKVLEVLIESVDTLENYLMKIKMGQIFDLSESLVNQLEHRIAKL